MKTRNFYDTDTARQYLNGCVIRHKGKPAYISDVGAGKSGRNNCLLHLTYTSGGVTNPDYFYVMNDDEEVNLGPFPIGFLVINSSSRSQQSVYISRFPARRMRVGLHTENCQIQSADDRRNRGYSYDTAIWTPQFELSVLNKYPSFKEVVEYVKPLEKARNNYMVPFSRRWAIGNSYELFYKVIGKSVGKMENDLPVLHKDFTYLKEALQEDINAQFY